MVMMRGMDVVRSSRNGGDLRRQPVRAKLERERPRRRGHEARRYQRTQRERQQQETADTAVPRCPELSFPHREKETQPDDHYNGKFRARRFSVVCCRARCAGMRASKPHDV
jgi:hypothetical protein